MENAGAAGPIQRMSGISATMMRNGDARFMMTESCLKCWFWSVFRQGFPGECILNKREAFKQAFDEFELETVCGYGEEKLQELKENAGIVRNSLKISAAVTNARIFRKIQAEYGSFDCYLWHWTEGKVICETGKTNSALSDRISEDLKKRGMKFVGTTVVYAYLQAVGVVWGHEENCFLSLHQGKNMQKK